MLIALSLGGLSTWGQPKVTYRQIVTSPIDSWVAVTDRTKAMNGETQEEASASNGNGQTIEGFGACFNELGWDALQKTKEEVREGFLKELYGAEGCAFNMGRVALGANDFSLEWNSCDDTDGDY